MEQIKFSTNWNNKLDCKAFTTIRIYNPNKYKVGETFEILLNSKPKGTAKLLEIRRLKVDQFNEFICRLDTGYTKEQTIGILKKMYQNIDFQVVTFAFCLLVYQDKETKAAQSTDLNRWPNV